MKEPYAETIVLQGHLDFVLAKIICWKLIIQNVMVYDVFLCDRIMTIWSEFICILLDQRYALFENMFYYTAQHLDINCRMKETTK